MSGCKPDLLLKVSSDWMQPEQIMPVSTFGGITHASDMQSFYKSFLSFSLSVSVSSRQSMSRMAASSPQSRLRLTFFGYLSLRILYVVIEPAALRSLIV